MEFLCTDDQTQPLLPLITATDTQSQDLDCVCLKQTDKMLSETPTENTSSLSGPSEKNTKPITPNVALLSVEPSTQAESLNNETCSFNMSKGFLLFPETATTDEAFKPLDYCDTSEPTVSPDGQFTCLTLTNIGAPSSTIMTDQEHISQPLTPRVLLSTPETLTDQCVAKPLFSDSFKSNECQAVSLLRSLSHQSDSSESDMATAPLSDLYIFESDMQDFILSPNLDPQEIKCHEYVPLSQTKASELQGDSDLGVCDSFKVMTKYDQDLSEERVCESDVWPSMELGPPAVDVWDVAKEKAEVTGWNPRNESPVELWVDACQYLAVDEAEDRTETVQSVMQGALSTSTRDFSVPPEETQGSGCRANACDVIGWSFDDNKSWGPPVERWSSVDSWESALSDWAEIISSPAEDFTAAFTEIGAEIDALTQALAEVTTQTETEQRKEGPVDELDQSPMGIQDKPLETQNITEGSVFTGQSCLSCCLGAEIQEKRGIDPLCSAENELEISHICQSEPQQQSMSSSEGISSERYSEDATALTVTQGAAFETVTDFLDFRYESQQTDINNEVVLNIVEDTDLGEKSAPAALLINKPSTDSKCEVKDGHVFSLLDLGAERDSERSSGLSGTHRVDCQGCEALSDLHFLSTLTTTNSNVTRVDTDCLNAHVLPNTLADLDRACQVEPQWGSPKFIMPLAPLSIGSSLVTWASSSLKGDQEATKWALNDNRDDIYDHTEAYDLWPDSDGITDFSLESDEGDPQQEQSETDSSENAFQDLKTDETIQSYFTESKTIFEESRDLLNLAVIPNDHFIVSEEKRVACFTLDLYDPFASRPITATRPSTERMPHKTNKSSSEGKVRPKKDRSTCHHHGAHASKKQEKLSCNVVAEQQPSTIQDDLTGVHDTGLENKESEPVTETGLVQQKGSSKHHGKKKKKHTGKSTAEPLVEAENEAKMTKAKTDVFENKGVTKGNDQSAVLHKNSDKSLAKTLPKDKQPQNTSTPNDDDDVIKKRRLSQDKFGKLVSSLESKLAKAETSKGAEDKADPGAARRKAYSEVVKQKTVIAKQDPKVVQPIQAASVSGDPQSLCLWCQFSGVFTDYTVTWSRDSAVLAEIKRSSGDESRVSLTISNASHKDLGKYQCRLSSAQGTVTLDYVLTYELLSEIVIPPTPKAIPSAPVQVVSEEENVNCSKLMFKEDFLTEQYFGESQSASIVTEKIHFGEGMHRRAFRTKLQTGQIPLLLPGHSCVLKVHNAISYGTKNNDELLQKNFNLAVEECQVQNTAREYIKAYSSVAQSFESFGQVPEIIPIYLVHRPSNDIPYATLEEELIGDFVKYSVKDGKEINLMRRDSEAGQKCCAFQHWVYHNTEGNLLVTDMQGVGMKLTDVGIATCKKGYKGFKGNCAMSFIDQFKVLHQCNTYCEILGLKSLQPKPKKTAPPPKSKAQPGATPKKKTFEPAAKGKS